MTGCPRTWTATVATVAAAAGAAGAQQPPGTEELPAPRLADLLTDSGSGGTRGASLFDDAAPSEWEFRLAPYFWLPAMTGDISIGPVKAHVDQDLSEVVDLLQDHLNFGGALHFEVEKGRWGILADAMYVDLRAQHDTALGTTVDANTQQFIGELGPFYTLYESPGDGRGVRIDALGGVRLTSLDSEIDPMHLGSTSDSRAWLDPFIGARASVGLNDWMTLDLRADIGGFSIDPGYTSNFVWNAIAGLSFRIGRAGSLNLGYRWLDYDYEGVKGPSAFTYNMRLHGPYIAFTFSF